MDERRLGVTNEVMTMTWQEGLVVLYAICVRYLIPAAIFLAAVGLVSYFAARKAVRDELRSGRTK